MFGQGQGHKPNLGYKGKLDQSYLKGTEPFHDKETTHKCSIGRLHKFVVQ